MTRFFSAVSLDSREVVPEHPGRGLSKGLILDEASARGSPCKCTPVSASAYLTTRPPRCSNGSGGQVGLGGG